MSTSDKKKLPTCSIARHSKIYPNWDFWFENKPSGNPVVDARAQKNWLHVTDRLANCCRTKKSIIIIFLNLVPVLALEM
jgi:hypothetical protein